MCLTQGFTSFIIPLLFLLTNTLAPAARANPNYDRGLEVRSFFVDLIEASAKSGKEQSQSIRETFINHPKVVQWVAEDGSLEALLADADLGGVRPSVAGEGEILQKLETLSKSQIDRILETASFQKEVKARLAVVNRAVTPQNIAFLATQLENKIEQNPQIKATALEETRGAARGFAALPLQERAQVLQVVPDDAFSEVGKEVNSSISKTKISDADAIHSLTAKGAFTVDKNMISEEEVGKYLRAYFDELPLQDRREMFVAFLKLPPNSSVEKELSTVLNHSGLLMQKLFQLVGETAESPLLQKVLDALKENVQPFSGEEAKRIIEKELGAPIHTIFKDFETSPLAAGTIGQVHRATLKDGTTVAVKVRRPNLVADFEREVAQVRRAAAGTPMAHFIDKIRAVTEHELDFKNEATFLDLGARAYIDPAKGLDVAKRIPMGNGISSEVLVTQMAEGRSMDKITKFSESIIDSLVAEEARAGQITPKTAGQRARQAKRLAWLNEAMEALYEKWFDNAIFGGGEYGVPTTGFFHGDLHAGNRFIQRTGSGPGYKMTFIDFGHTGALPMSERRSVLRFAMSAAAGAPSEMLHTLEQLIEIPPEKRVRILEAFKKVDWSSLTLADRMALAITEVSKEEVFLPNHFLSFYRAKQFLDNDIAELNLLLDKVDPSQKFRRVDPAKAMLKISAKRLAVEVPGQLFNSAIRQNTATPISQTTASALRIINEKISNYFTRCKVSLLGALLKPKK